MTIPEQVFRPYRIYSIAILDYNFEEIGFRVVVGDTLLTEYATPPEGVGALLATPLATQDCIILVVEGGDWTIH